MSVPHEAIDRTPFPHPKKVVDGFKEEYPQILAQEPIAALATNNMLDAAERAYGGGWKTGLLAHVACATTVLHQCNEREAKRRRRDGSPYITHPIEIAHSLLGASPYPDIPPEFLSRVYDVEIPATALLHDVVEDCVYQGYRGRGLFSVIQAVLSPYESYRAGITDRICTNVEALTDYGKLEEMPPDVHDALLHSQLVKNRAEHLSGLPGFESSPEELMEECVKAMGSIYHIFEVANRNPDPHGRMQTIVSCLLSKGRDVLNNLGDKRVAPFKVARALELAAMLRYVGSDSSSALLIRLSELFDLGDPGSGLLHMSDLSVLDRLNTHMQNPEYCMVADTNNVPLLFSQPHPELPVLTHSEADSSGTGAHFAVQMRFNAAHRVQKGVDTITVHRGRGEVVSAKRVDAPMHEVLRQLGRNVHYFKLSNGDLIKISDQNAHLCDTVTDGFDGTVDPICIPEAGLFDPIILPQSNTPNRQDVDEVVTILEICSPLPNTARGGNRIMAFNTDSSEDGAPHAVLIPFFPA